MRRSAVFVPLPRCVRLPKGFRNRAVEVPRADGKERAALKNRPNGRWLPILRIDTAQADDRYIRSRRCLPHVPRKWNPRIASVRRTASFRRISSFAPTWRNSPLPLRNYATIGGLRALLILLPEDPATAELYLAVQFGPKNDADRRDSGNILFSLRLRSAMHRTILNVFDRPQSARR